MATQLKMPEAATLFNATMQEELAADQLLIKIGAQEADKRAAA